MNRLMSWVIWGAIILNLLGFFIDATWLKDTGKAGYFTYKISVLNNFPYWILATLIFLGLNGAAALCLASIRFHLTAKERNYQGGLPLPHIRLLGVNLVLIPLLLFFFILIRVLG